MCGICGFAGSPRDPSKVWSLMKNLLVATQCRGRDGAGFFALSGDEILYDKAAVPAELFVETSGLFRLMADKVPELFVGHCRAASVGDTVLRNCHPFVSQDEQWGLVHNGTLKMLECNALSYYGKQPEGETDSELIIRFLETFGSIPEGISHLFSLVCVGSQTCVTGDAQEHSIWLWRNDGPPLWCLSLQKTWGVSFFFSTPEIFQAAWRATFKNKLGLKKRVAMIPLKSFKLYRLDKNAILYSRDILIKEVQVISGLDSLKLLNAPAI
jgi:predicted glutamine amidotransferase